MNIEDELGFCLIAVSVLISESLTDCVVRAVLATVFVLSYVLTCRIEVCPTACSYRSLLSVFYRLQTNYTLIAFLHVTGGQSNIVLATWKGFFLCHM